MTTMKIRIVMHYDFKLKNSAADAARNINRAYGNNTVCKYTRPGVLNLNDPRIYFLFS